MPAFSKKINFLKKPFILLLAITIVHMILSIYYRDETWDDSAITLGFAKNIIEHQDFIPGQYSDRCEGSSAFLWVLINAAIYSLVKSPATLLTAAKTSSILCNLINAVLLYKLLKYCVNQNALIVIGLTTFMLSAVSIQESINGMETPLLTTFLLSSLLLYPQIKNNRLKFAGFCLTSTLIIFIRHEGALYLIPFAIAELFKHRLRIFKNKICYLWAILFFSYNIWHYNFFGTILTNPMLAKTFPPYSPELTSLAQKLHFHLLPIRTFILLCFPVVIPALIGALRYGHIKETLRAHIKTHNLHWMIIVLMLLVNTYIGFNWGPTNRMLFPVFPITIIALLSLADKYTFKPKSLVFLIPALLIPHFLYQANVFKRDLSQLPSVHSIKNILSSVENIRNAAEIEKLTYTGPDMGAFLLFGNNMRIIDIGLLCNSHLARSGHSQTKALLRSEVPDIIETHGMWTYYSQINSMESLTEEYTLVVLNRIILLVKKHHINKIQNMTRRSTDLQAILRAESDKYSCADNTLIQCFDHYFLIEPK